MGRKFYYRRRGNCPGGRPARRADEAVSGGGRSAASPRALGLLGVDLGPDPVADLVEVVLGLVEQRRRGAVGDAGRLVRRRRRHQRALRPGHRGQPPLVLRAVRPGSATARRARGRGRTCGRCRRWRTSGSRSACTPGASASSTSVRASPTRHPWSPGPPLLDRSSSRRAPTGTTQNRQAKRPRAQRASLSSASESRGKARATAPAVVERRPGRRARTAERPARRARRRGRGTPAGRPDPGHRSGADRASESIQTCWTPYLNDSRRSRARRAGVTADRVTLATIAEALGVSRQHGVQRLQPPRPAQPGDAREGARRGPRAGLRRARPAWPAALRRGAGRRHRADREVAARRPDRSGVAADARRCRRGLRRGRRGARADPPARRRATRAHDIVRSAVVDGFVAHCDALDDERRRSSRSGGCRSSCSTAVPAPDEPSVGIDEEGGAVRRRRAPARRSATAAWPSIAFQPLTTGIGQQRRPTRRLDGYRARRGRRRRRPRSR